ncbi:MAG TPA: LemA family protein [Acidimicrobiales bacterium]
MSVTLAGLVGCGVALVGWIWASYNRFALQREMVENSWSTVDTELRRRYDLIPNLVATVKGYAAHERQTLETVVEARSQAVAATGAPEDQAPAENRLVDGLKQLFAVAEAYPDLKADAHFLELQKELAATENRIQAARRIFNGNVRDLNRRVQQVPSNLVAKLGGFHRAEYFQIDETAREVPVASLAPDLLSEAKPVKS